MNQFDALEAVSLYCRQCQRAMPVRKRLLLVLLDEEVYEYLCAECGGSLGQKKEPVRPPDLGIL
jgi:predicted SprT family Zn-dependent metalloprotease